MNHTKGFLIVLAFVCFLPNGFGQNDKNDIYSEVYRLGKSFASRLKRGDLSQFQNVTPAKGTWVMEDLLAYKSYLQNEKEQIYFGEFVEPSTDPDVLGYNLFAYKKVGNSVNYFFAAVISFNVAGSEPKFETAYLFTQRESLKSWWSHVFGFYHTKRNKEVERSFSYPNCPPPPFKD